MKALIRFFSERPLLCNTLMLMVFILGVKSWYSIGKEEMPEFSREAMSVFHSYPGAAAEDVERLVTKPIEEKLKTISGVADISSTASFAGSRIRVEFERGVLDLASKIAEVEDVASQTQLPAEVEEPEFWQFNSSQKAIIDVAIYHQEKRLLDAKSREILQKYALAFRNRVTNLPKVALVDDSGYLNPEIRIEVIPKKLLEYNISLNEIKNKIKGQNLSIPLGSIVDAEESSISLSAEKHTVESLENLIVRQGFTGHAIRLGQLAQVRKTFEKATSTRKVQGHEAVIFYIKKTSSSDILSARDQIVEFIDAFKDTYKDSPIKLVVMDDESYDVRNRIGLIAGNGLVGFILIVLVLFVFLDFKSGLWVGLGIPFALSFTLLSAALLGYTVNNMTLCAVIIVIGIVVDDAIIVAENIHRRMSLGESPSDAAVNGTYQVVRAIIAAILTTCVAFVPLYFFEARFGALLKFIPLIIFLMLGASLFESVFILPAHMKSCRPGHGDQWRAKILRSLERVYISVMARLLRFRILLILTFCGMLFGSGWIFITSMKFVMFPREESTSVSVRIVGPKGIDRIQMARLLEPLEDYLVADEIVESVSSYIGLSRRGNDADGHQAYLSVEVQPPDKRSIHLKQKITEWEGRSKEFKGLSSIKFLKSRWGHSSGSAIEIDVLENNNENRATLVKSLQEKLKSFDFLANVEVESTPSKTEYRLHVNDDQSARLGINIADIASSLRTFLAGSTLYTINSGDEPVDVIMLSAEDDRRNIKQVLDHQVSNRESYLVPISSVVALTEGQKPVRIKRSHFKRSTEVYADLKDGVKITPLEVASRIEGEIFAKLKTSNPSADFVFRGEIEDSRASKSDFLSSVLLVLLFIYVILVFLYDSVFLPLVIASTIPFGVIGVVVAFYAHGMNNYGFFAVIGTLGMIGVVVNDAIVMVARFEEDSANELDKLTLIQSIAKAASTRLRPIILTSLTTVVGLFPTAYGLFGYDSMLAEMMLAMGWGLFFSTVITLVFLPCVYSYYTQIRCKWRLYHAPR